MGGNAQMVALSEVVDMLSGGTPSKSRSDYWIGEIPWVSAKDMKQRQLRNAEDHISTSALANGSKLAPSNATLILIRGMTLLHDVPICALERDVAFNQDVKALVPRENIDPSYLTYALLAAKPKLLSMVELAGHGTGRLPTDRLKALEIPFPEKSRQRAIAYILGTLDDKIDLNRRMNETLEAIARAIFKSWFVDFDPVRAKAEGRDTGLPKEIADLFPDSFEDSELGEIPKGWEVAGLPDAIDFLEGPGLRNWQYRDEGMKFLNIRCINDGDLEVEKANSIGLEEFNSSYRHFALCEDDIVLSTSGTLGRLAIVRADHLPIMLNTSIIRMRGRNAFGLTYIWAFLQSELFRSEMFALAAGSVQLNFGPMHLRQMAIVHPTDSILKSFERIMQPLLRKAIRLRVESRTLAALRDALLPRLMSGDIELRPTVINQSECVRR